MTFWIVLVLSTLLSILGITSVTVYVVGVIDVVINQEPDRSWIYWGLGFGLFGLICLATGVGLMVVARSLRKSAAS